MVVIVIHLLSISVFWFGVHIFFNQVYLVFVFVWEPYITFNKEGIKTLQQVFLVILTSWLVTGCVELQMLIFGAKLLWCFVKNAGVL